MRLWTLHPRYLDAIGLVALWREALLAQAVLKGETVGYRHHPQLARFKSHPAPLAAIATYLQLVYEEAQTRGYRFDKSKIGRLRTGFRIVEHRGQLAYEWQHLRAKLLLRRPDWLRRLNAIAVPQPHPLFRLVRGSVRDWERVGPGPAGASPKRARNRTRSHKAKL